VALSYNAANRLSSHTDTAGTPPTPVTGSYAYDGYLRRAKQVVGGVTRYSVYDVSGGLVSIDQAGAGPTEYIRASGMVLARVAGAAVTWLHPDHLGSAVAGTGTTGSVVWRESEQPFGEDWISAPANDNQAGYTGHVEDAATGLVYMQARYYDPVTGRFLANDPVGFSPQRPDMFNRYAYAANDPVNMVDPDGEKAVGFRVEGQAVAGTGGKFSVEVSVDFKTGEVRASGSVGARLGLKGQGSIELFAEPSSKKGNSLRGQGVVSAEASAEIKTPLGTGEVSSSAEFGVGTDGLIPPSADSLFDLSGNWGPISVDENDRASLGVGGGLGGSAGTEYAIEGSLSIPDTVEAAKVLVENIKEQFE